METLTGTDEIVFSRGVSKQQRWVSQERLPEEVVFGLGLHGVNKYLFRSSDGRVGQSGDGRLMVACLWGAADVTPGLESRVLRKE